MAGYPEAHPDTIVDDPEQMAKAYQENLAYLKAKVGGGGGRGQQGAAGGSRGQQGAAGGSRGGRVWGQWGG